MGYIAELNGHYLELLKSFACYDNTTVEILEPQPFKYQDPSNEKLQELRTLYNLDTIAGDGEEIQRILNLTKWVHNSVRHDGNFGFNPTERNALYILGNENAIKQGVGCRILATVLNDVFLSMGFKTRHITCLPADKDDEDCHVVNVVYLNSLNKWVYIDPTWEAYFMDKSGTTLSISEIREAMQTDEKLFLNDNLNWNGTPTEKEWYFHYMSKNFFRFWCPSVSEFNHETENKDNLYYLLYPTNYSVDEPMIQTRSNGRKAVNFITTNPNLYWMKP
jgi:hypothetical protein